MINYNIINIQDIIIMNEYKMEYAKESIMLSNEM
jgi:hypothetical protein